MLYYVATVIVFTHYLRSIGMVLKWLKTKLTSQFYYFDVKLSVVLYKLLTVFFYGNNNLSCFYFVTKQFWKETTIRYFESEATLGCKFIISLLCHDLSWCVRQAHIDSLGMYEGDWFHLSRVLCVIGPWNSVNYMKEPNRLVRPNIPIGIRLISSFDNRVIKSR